VFRRIQQLYKDFQPAAVGSNETKALFTVKKGQRVIAASYRCEIAAAASTDTTMTLGDGTDTDGFIAAIDLEAASAGGLGNGAGALLATDGGKLYTADDTVDVVYSGTTYGATNPKFTFCITIVTEWQ
jgi:hypothetical protein